MIAVGFGETGGQVSTDIFSLLCDPGGLLLSGGHWRVGEALPHMISGPAQGNQLLVYVQTEASLPPKSQNRRIPFVVYVC